VSNLICRGLSFAYDGAESETFTNLDLVIDTGWRAALVGANGRGKTTLLRLLAGVLRPDRGEVERPVSCLLFSSEAAPGLTAFAAAKDVSGPFRAWEREIETLLVRGDEPALIRYGEIESNYRALGGYELDARLAAELDCLGISSALSQRPFDALSGGEQTRARLAGLFAADGAYPLIDEPTNHLDLDGRRLLAEYLAAKTGFLLVSHDRAFLDAAVDHVIALNPETVDVQRSDYSTWRHVHLSRLAEQARSNALLKKDIARLETAARSRRAGAEARESDKTAGGKPRLPSERGGDSGFIGARAARQMKRALAAERRAGQAADRRRESLTDVEKAYPLTLSDPPTPAPATAPLVRVRDLRIGWDDWLFEPLTFEVRAGERLALMGPNGCGKTSLLALLDGVPASKVEGDWQVHSRILTSRAWQIPRWRTGRLRDHLAASGLDEPRFRQLMAALGVRGGVLDQPLEHLSQGQLKKIELARSLGQPAHLYLWDEPLNYVDVDARERIEAALLESSFQKASLLEAGAAIIFIEHDARFVDTVATRRVLLASADGNQIREKGDE
jgi:lincosamide and streptogramin A transport system ATP-binding/permease protein